MITLSIIGAALLAFGWPVMLTARDPAGAFFGVLFTAAGFVMLFLAALRWLIPWLVPWLI